MPTLKLEHLEKARKWTIDVDDEAFSIGRSRKARVSIPDLSVSKEHVRIELRAGRFHFRDLGSKNGTYLNDLRVDEGALHDGDQLRIGKIRITFLREKELVIPPLDDVDLAFAGDTPVLESPAGLEDMPLRVEEGEREPLSELDTLADASPVVAEQPDSDAAGSRIEGARPPVGRVRPARTDRAAARHSARFERAAAPSRSWSTPALVLTALFFLFGGFTLGRLSYRISDGERAGTVLPEPEPSPDPGSLPPLQALDERLDAPGGPADESRNVPSGPADAGALDLTLARILGPRADLSDPEVSTRSVMRLFLDVLDRTPTRAEARRVGGLSHEERWKAVRSIRAEGSGGPLDDSATDTYRRFLGRVLSPTQHDRLAAEARGDPDRLGFLLASSPLYAAKEHRRPRSELQRARSLWVDVLDRVPTEEDTRSVLEELQRASGDPSSVVRVVVNSPPAEAIRPPDGADLGAWVRDLYARTQLEFPTASELEASLDVLGKGPDGWRHVVLELVLREQYGTY